MPAGNSPDQHVERAQPQRPERRKVTDTSTTTRRRIGFRAVVRDLLSCLPWFRLPYQEPTDELTAYVRAVCIYGPESAEATQIYERNAGDDYFRERADVLRDTKRNLAEGG